MMSRSDQRDSDRRSESARSGAGRLPDASHPRLAAQKKLEGVSRPSPPILAQAAAAAEMVVPKDPQPAESARHRPPRAPVQTTAAGGSLCGAHTAEMWTISRGCKRAIPVRAG